MAVGRKRRRSAGEPGYNPGAMLKTREDVAAELQRVRESVRERALHPREAGDVLPPALAPRAPAPIAPEPGPEPGADCPGPDAADVNAHWRAEAPLPHGA